MDTSNSALKEWWKANAVEANRRKDGMLIISVSGQS